MEDKLKQDNERCSMPRKEFIGLCLTFGVPIILYFIYQELPEQKFKGLHSTYLVDRDNYNAFCPGRRKDCHEIKQRMDKFELTWEKMGKK